MGPAAPLSINVEGPQAIFAGHWPEGPPFLTPGYNVSRALADILGPMVGTTVHHINNSFDVAEDLASAMIEEDEQFISHDVVSPFTNTPIEECLNIIRDKLVKDEDLKNRTLLEVEDIMQLMKFILTTTYFTFRGTIYKFGAAIGSPINPRVVGVESDPYITFRSFSHAYGSATLTTS